jgi:hypothetical protein
MREVRMMRKRRRKPQHHEVFKCPHCDCGTEWRVSQENLNRVGALLAERGLSTIDISYLPDGPDWLGHISDEDIAEAITAAGRP